MGLIFDFLKSIFMEKTKELWRKMPLSLKMALILIILLASSIGYLFVEFDGDIEINLTRKSTENTGSNVGWANLYFGNYLLKTTYDTSLLSLRSKYKVLGSETAEGKLEFSRKDVFLTPISVSLTISKAKNCELYLERMKNFYENEFAKNNLIINFGKEKFYGTYIKSEYILNLPTFKNWKTLKISTCFTANEKLFNIPIAPCKSDLLDFLQEQYLTNQYFVCLDGEHVLQVQDWHKNIDKNRISFSAEKILFKKNITF